MATDFELLVSALWAELDLGASTRDGTPARLTVDGQAVALAPSLDERSVVVSADLGPLAADPLRAAGQLRRLLRDGAGAALRHAAAVRVAAGPDGTRRALVEAACPCRRGGTAALTRAIEDALAVADLHRTTVTGAGPRVPRIAPAIAPVPDDHLIFRL